MERCEADAFQARAYSLEPDEPRNLPLSKMSCLLDAAGACRAFLFASPWRRRRSRSVLLTFVGMSPNLADGLDEPGLLGREDWAGVGPGR